MDSTRDLIALGALGVAIYYTAVKTSRNLMHIDNVAAPKHAKRTQRKTSLAAEIDSTIKAQKQRDDVTGKATFHHDTTKEMKEEITAAKHLADDAIRAWHNMQSAGPITGVRLHRM